MKTGMQFTNAQPASSTCSTYHLVAISLPTGRKLTTTCVRVSRRMFAMSAVEPGAFRIICDRYWPRPSCVIPRCTGTPSGLTSAKRTVLFGSWQIACQVAPDLALVDVERGRELDVADVVGPEARVHQAGDELAVRGVLVVLDALDEGRRAIADADDGDSNGPHGLLLTDVRSRA